MRIDSLLDASTEPVFSFEFFPPEGSEATDALFQTIGELRRLEPAFVSVTCRNHSRLRTLDIVTRIRNEVGIEPMAHYTCAGATLDELHTVLQGLADAGIDNVLALRGDRPAEVNGADGEAPAGDNLLTHGSQLAELIRDNYDFCIGGACYPEGHSEAADAEENLRHTRLKVASGVTFLITQLFFENRHYFTFVNRARAAGIMVPIIPGIMPITNVRQLSRFSATLFGATIPQRLRDALERADGNREAVLDFGVAYATLQCAELLAGGAPGIHFYTLNRSPATRAILSALRAAEPWTSISRSR